MNSIYGFGLEFDRVRKKVFNTTVDNSVEKPDRIAVSDSARDSSALCTGAGAGTFVVRKRADGGFLADFPVPSNREN
jgi:hypothetical protein